MVIRPGDGQNEPADGLKVVANEARLDNFVLQLGPTRHESRRLWDAPPADPRRQPLLAASSEPPILMAQTPGGDALMAGQEVGKGRTLAFGGETWVWARDQRRGPRGSHRKFWRQAILWLAHKEDEGQGQVKLQLDHRRVAVGQKVELSAARQGLQGRAPAGAKFETTVTYLGPGGKAEPVTLYNQGAESRGSFYGTQGARTLPRHRLRHARRQGPRPRLRAVPRLPGRPRAGQPRRRPRPPEADRRDHRRQPLVPERLDKYLATLDDEKFTNFERQEEYRLWDNWPFLLTFTALLSAEWWLRKRKGWV